MSHERNQDEEQWFQAREQERRQEIRESLNKAAREAREKRSMGETLGTGDEAILERLRALHFDSDTARVIDLLPLVYVAWADGSVKPRERAAILDVLRERSIQGHEQAFLLIESLLETEPSAEFLDEILEILAMIAGDRPQLVADIAKFSVAVADSSGGFFGLGNRIDERERATIQRIADGLGGDANATFAAAIKNVS